MADIADYIELRFGRERADRFNDEIDAEGEALGRDFRMYTGTGNLLPKEADSEEDI